MKRRIGLLALVSLFFLFSGNSANVSAETSSQTSTLVNSITLQQDSTVTISTWLGNTSCPRGDLYLISPELKVVSGTLATSPVKRAVNPAASTSGKLILTYGVGYYNATFGQYPAGTKLNLGMYAASFCNVFATLENGKRSKIEDRGNGSFLIGWEDYGDNDFNDVYTFVKVTPTQTGFEADVTATQAFSEKPVYKLPWPTGTTHKLTVTPDVGHHKGYNAYDFEFKLAEDKTVVASEQGLILWIEDSFGTGSCNETYRSSANVVVIQTASGVNQTYVHLEKGSVTSLGLKVGDHVRQGQTIGQAGKSGFVCATNNILHTEWQPNCYDLNNVAAIRPKVGTATLRWSCTPGFPPNSPHEFTLNSAPVSRTYNDKNYTSDNK